MIHFSATVPRNMFCSVSVGLRWSALQVASLNEKGSPTPSVCKSPCKRRFQAEWKPLHRRSQGRAKQVRRDSLGHEDTSSKQSVCSHPTSTETWLVGWCCVVITYFMSNFRWSRFGWSFETKHSTPLMSQNCHYEHNNAKHYTSQNAAVYRRVAQLQLQ